MKKKAILQSLEDVKWLSEVREVRHAIDQTHPLLVRVVDVSSGPVPQPSVPFPEKHPYCEIGMTLEGTGVQYIGREKIKRSKGDIMLLGPGTPHYAIRHSYPQRIITVHLLPILLFELGPEKDGARILNRFTANQSIADRVIRPSASIAQSIQKNLEQMAHESSHLEVGWEFRVRALLMESLVSLIRWEKASGKGVDGSLQSNWSYIEKTLRYMHENFSEPLYMREIAKAIGLTANGLQGAFRKALGMSCVQYLMALRISHAKALLSSPDARVTEVAFAVGFETLSHFNSSFRNQIGMSPTEYMRSVHGKRG